MSQCEYEGCDEPALENSDKCTFHKPDKNEEEAKEFYKSIRQEARKPEGEIVKGKEEEGVKKWVFEKELDWSGYRFPELPSDNNLSHKLFTFNEAIFKKEISCKETLFSGDLFFKGAKFEAESNFHNSVFKGDLFFGGTTFEGEASFDNAIFEGVAGFQVSFEGVASFGGVKFNDKAWFSGACFGEYTEFGGSEFENKVDFENAEFQKVWFGGSEFSGITEFSRTKFEGGASFDKARFEREVFFNYATFKRPVFFTNIEFNEDVKFKGTEFRDVTSFGDTDFKHSCDFGGAVFSKEIVLNKTHFVRHPDFVSDLKELSSGVSFETNEIKRSLDFLDDENKLVHRVVIKTDSEKEDVVTERKKAIEKLQDLNKQDHERPEIKTTVQKFTKHRAKIEACREQRLNYEARGKKEEADQVFVHEMRARRELKGSIANFLHWLIADLTCKYGTSWQRVLGVSIFMVIGFGLLYNGIELGLNNLANFINAGLGESLYQSTIVFTTLGYDGGFFTGSPLLKAMSAVESAFGALFVALIILVFARKWMRG